MIEKGRQAAVAKLTPDDHNSINDLNHVADKTGWLNYTIMDAGSKTTPKGQSKLVKDDYDKDEE